MHIIITIIFLPLKWIPVNKRSPHWKRPGLEKINVSAEKISIPFHSCHHTEMIYFIIPYMPVWNRNILILDFKNLFFLFPFCIFSFFLFLAFPQLLPVANTHFPSSHTITDNNSFEFPCKSFRKQIHTHVMFSYHALQNQHWILMMMMITIIIKV